MDYRTGTALPLGIIQGTSVFKLIQLVSEYQKTHIHRIHTVDMVGLAKVNQSACPGTSGGKTLSSAQVVFGAIWCMGSDYIHGQEMAGNY